MVPLPSDALPPFSVAASPSQQHTHSTTTTQKHTAPHPPLAALRANLCARCSAAAVTVACTRLRGSYPALTAAPCPHTPPTQQTHYVSPATNHCLMAPFKNGKCLFGAIFGLDLIQLVDTSNIWGPYKVLQVSHVPPTRYIRSMRVRACAFVCVCVCLRALGSMCGWCGMAGCTSVALRMCFCFDGHCLLPIPLYSKGAPGGGLPCCPAALAHSCRLQA